MPNVIRGILPHGSCWESLGFRREAHLRQNVYFWKDADGSPIWKDTYVYAILESDESIRKDSKL